MSAHMTDRDILCREEIKMIRDRLDTILDEFFAHELREAPRSFDGPTSDCPPLVQFPKRVKSGWNEKDRSHVTHCDFCQRITALQWRIECPTLLTVVRNSLVNAPDAKAL